MRRAELAIVVAVVAVSFSSILIRLAYIESVRPLAVAFFRLAFTTLLLLPLAVAHRRSTETKLTSNDLIKMAGIGLTLALHFSFWIKSLELTTVASSVILVTIHPLFVAAVSHLLMEERLSKLNVLGILAALGGATIMTYADYSGGIFAGGSALGNILALLGGVAAGVYILGGRDMRSSLDLLTYVFPVYSFCTVFLFVAVSLTATPLGPITPMAWILLLLMALGPGLLGHTVYNWSLKHVPATVVSVSLLGEPVGASILAFTLLGEVPSLVVILGGSIVLAGIFLTSIRGDSEQEQR